MRKDTSKTWQLRREAGRVRGLSQFVFAVDDSEVEIRGVRHTILAAIGFNDPTTAIDEMGRLRADLGVAADFEFKWNRQFENPDHRRVVSDGFQNILAESIGLVTITEGTDRQHAAELLAVQIADLVEEPVLPIVIFDEGIIRDAAAFRRFLLEARNDAIRRLQVATARSFANDLVQCADLFAGFHNLKIRLALGDARDRQIQFDDGRGEMEMPLSMMLEMAFRYALWGPEIIEVDPEWDYENGPPPGRYKEPAGFGLRIHSSLDAETQSLLYDEVGLAYTGCWS
jgi:hypothetical protein